MAHDAFLSYSQRDKPTADAVVAGLEQGGIRCWMAPRDILPGTSWGEAIVDAIAVSRAMVVVLSAEANASAQVIREVERAVAEGVIVVPFRIEEIRPTGAMAYFLGPQHWLDAITPPLQGHIDRLRNTLRTLLEGAPAGVTPAVPVGEGVSGPVLAVRRSLRVVPWFRRPLVWVGAVAVAVAAGMVVLLVGGGEEPDTTPAVSTTLLTSSTVASTSTAAPTSTEAVTTSVAPATTAVSPSTVPTGAGLVWAKLPGEETEPLFQSLSTCDECAVLGDFTFGVTGGEPVPGAGHSDARVRSTANGPGSSWTSEVTFGGPGNQSMTGVVAGGPGLVVVGWEELTAASSALPWNTHGGDADAAVWTSVDGTTWERVRDDEAILGGPGDQVMLAVVAGGPGLVAVGYDASLGSGDTDAAVWTSIDGTVWERVSHDEAVFGASRMVVMEAEGWRLVAAGFTFQDGEEDAEVWTSIDGLVWERVPRQAALGHKDWANQRIQVMVAGGPGLVAAGYDDYGGDADAAVWTSANGIVWERVPHDESVFGGPGYQDMYGLWTDGSRLVAIGTGTDLTHETAWVSPPHG